MKQPIPIFEGHVVDKKLRMFDRVRVAIARYVSTFKDGTKLDIVITKHKSKRSNLQNRYYWAVVIPILADHFGHDNPEDMHEDLKLEFNPVQSKIDPSKKIGGSTTKMDTVEFFSAEDSYVEKICRWAAEEGIYIPPPNKEMT